MLSPSRFPSARSISPRVDTVSSVNQGRGSIGDSDGLFDVSPPLDGYPRLLTRGPNIESERNVHLGIYKRVFEGLVVDPIVTDAIGDRPDLFLRPFETNDIPGWESILGHRS